MRLSDIIQIVQAKISQSINTTSRFKPDDIRLMYMLKQREIAIKSHCFNDGYFSYAATANVQEHALQPDVDEIIAVKYGSVPLKQLRTKPIVSVEPTGTPSHYYLRGDNAIGLWPTPSASGSTVAIWFYRKTETYGFQMWRNNASSALRSCTAAFNTTALVLTEVTTGGVTTTYTYAYSTYTDMALMKTVVENVTNYYFKYSPDSPDKSMISGSMANIFGGIEYRENVNILYSSTVLPATTDTGGDVKPRFYFDPELPVEAQEIAIVGIVEDILYSDRDPALALPESSEYRRQLAEFCATYQRRNRNHVLPAINDVYGLSGRGRGAYGGGGISVFIP